MCAQLCRLLWSTNADNCGSFDDKGFILDMVLNVTLR